MIFIELVTMNQIKIQKETQAEGTDKVSPESYYSVEIMMAIMKFSGKQKDSLHHLKTVLATCTDLRSLYFQHLKPAYLLYNLSVFVSLSLFGLYIYICISLLLSLLHTDVMIYEVLKEKNGTYSCEIQKYIKFDS